MIIITQGTTLSCHIMGNCLDGVRQRKKSTADPSPSSNNNGAVSAVYTVGAPSHAVLSASAGAGNGVISSDATSVVDVENVKFIDRGARKSNQDSKSLTDPSKAGKENSSTSSPSAATPANHNAAKNDSQSVMKNGTTTSKKSQKYIAKFDHRVTAKYDIKALIGRGEFSHVVRVEQRLTKQPYAIKMVDRLRGKDVGDSELNVLRRVRHMYVIQLIEVFESRDKLYMVVELATGGELFERVINVGHFTERDAARVLRMVLEGLRYLHSLGIAHRDLKPENLLFYHPGEDSKILITDFGLSAIRKASPSGPGRSGGPDTVEEQTIDDTCMKTICGTPEYIAPEILMRLPYTGQVDLWAVGVITYILLSGTMPFDDENRRRLYRLILKAMYNYDGDHWKDISQLAKDFIDRLLLVDPWQRLTAAEALVHPWITSPVPVRSPGTSVCSSSRSEEKNLQRTISRNLMERRASLRSSDKSHKSGHSDHSVRSEHRRVASEEIDELHRDPQMKAELSSVASRMSGRSGHS